MDTCTTTNCDFEEQKLQDGIRAAGFDLVKIHSCQLFVGVSASTANGTFAAQAHHDGTVGGHCDACQRLAKAFGRARREGLAVLHV